MFSLDYGKIETSEDKYGHLSNGGPKLVEHNLDEIFGDEMSYKLPATMSSARSNMVIIRAETSMIRVTASTEGSEYSENLKIELVRYLNGNKTGLQPVEHPLLALKIVEAKYKTKLGKRLPNLYIF